MFQITIQSSTVGAESFRSSYNFQADSNRLYSKTITNITFNSPPVQLQFLISWTNYYLSIPNISRFRTHFKFYSSTIHYLPVCDIALIVWLPIYFHRLDIDIFTTYSRGQYCERFSIIQMHHNCERWSDATTGYPRIFERIAARAERSWFKLYSGLIQKQYK